MRFGLGNEEAWKIKKKMLNMFKQHKTQTLTQHKQRRRERSRERKQGKEESIDRRN